MCSPNAAPQHYGILSIILIKSTGNCYLHVSAIQLLSQADDFEDYSTFSTCLKLECGFRKFSLGIQQYKLILINFFYFISIFFVQKSVQQYKNNYICLYSKMLIAGWKNKFPGLHILVPVTYRNILDIVMKSCSTNYSNFIMKLFGVLWWMVW